MTRNRPDRPTPIALKPSNIPEQLKSIDQWVCWQYKWDDDRDEWTKVPIKPYDDRNGIRHNVDPDHEEHGNPESNYNYAGSTWRHTWRSFEKALDYHESGTVNTDGIGFVVSPQDRVCGLDLDDCRDENIGNIAPWAEEVLDEVPTYWEVSPSGTGFRGIGLGKVPSGGNKASIEDAEGDIEMYSSGRYLTITGHEVVSSTSRIRDIEHEIVEVHSRYIANGTPSQETEDLGISQIQGDAFRISESLDDEELLHKAMEAKNGDKFQRLWEGDWSAYPSHSEARQALINLLAFWTGSDRKQMRRLFQQSQLANQKLEKSMRDFDDHAADKALNFVNEQYSPEGKIEDDGNEKRGGDTPHFEAVLHDSDDFRALQDHVSDIEKLPQPIEIAKQFESNEGDPYDGPKALQGVKHNRLADAVWKLSRPHLELQPLTDGTILKYDSGVWVEGGEQILQEAAEYALGKYCANSVVSQLKGKVFRTGNTIKRSEMGVPEGTVAVENGLLDLSDFSLDELQPEHKAITKLPVNYDLEATCPRFAEFLESSVREEDVLKLQEYTGYLLHHWRQPYKKALLLIGPTDSGKSTFLRMVRLLLGRDNVATETLYSLMNTRWGTAQLHGKIANVRNELTPREVKNPQRFKELTGGEDMVDAEFKGKDKFSFVVTQKFLFATNRVPDIEHRDEAFNNRWLFVGFPNSVPPQDQDPDLLNRFEEELSGILNWAIEGYQRLQEQGRFSHERPLGEKESMWEEFGGPIDRFKREELEVTGNSDHYEIKARIHEEFTRFCDELGEQAATQSKLTRSLNTVPNITQGQRRFDGTREEVLIGVRFKDPNLRSIPDDDDEEPSDGSLEGFT